MHALILAPFHERHLNRLRARMDVSYESWLDTLALTDPDDLTARIIAEDVSILVVEADFVFEETFQECPGLKFVGICRASMTQVDLEAAAEHGVLVVNTPGRNACAVAEHALALIFSLARRITQAHELVSSGSWLNPVAGYTDLRGVEVGARTIGVIGLGAIGRTLAEMCTGLGMKVVAYDPYVTDVPDRVIMTDLRTLAQVSDFVSVHVPATPDTTGLLDAAFFAQMKQSAYLVNCSDYQVVVETALLDALRDRRISGAAFDVFETHPIAPDSPLLGLDNVVLTPHIGGATDETMERHSRMMADDIISFIEGRRPVNLVNPEVWPDCRNVASLLTGEG